MPHTHTHTRTFNVRAAHERPLLSDANWMPTALELARPEYLNEFKFIRLLGSEVSTTLPDLFGYKGGVFGGGDKRGGGSQKQAYIRMSRYDM